MTSYMTPRPHPRWAGTIIRCMCHSLSRSVAGSRTLSISACRSAFDQQLVAVTPAGTGTLVLPGTTFRFQPALAKVVVKYSVPGPDRAGTGWGATDPVSVETSRVA